MKIDIEIKDKYIHYLIDKNYLGMLTYTGEVSDFRAIVRKNKFTINNDNLMQHLKTTLYELLIHYLREVMFTTESNLGTLKQHIVQKNLSILSTTTENILSNYYLGE